MNCVNMVIDRVLEEGDCPDVYTDIDEKPVIVMTQAEQQETTETKQYRCDVCDEMYCHSSSIKEHMLQHKRSRPLHCSRCDQYFVLGESFRAHKQKHELEDTVQCPICNKRIKSVDGLTTHMKLHEKPEESYECGICCKLFGHPSSLVNHMESHTVNPIYECHKCHVRLSTPKLLKLHEMKKHNIYDVKMYPFKCCLCERRFKKRATLTNHEWEHRNGFNLAKVSNVSKVVMSDQCNSKVFIQNDRGTLNATASVSETPNSMGETRGMVESLSCDTYTIDEARSISYFNKGQDINRYELNQLNDRIAEHYDTNENNIDNCEISNSRPTHDAAEGLMDTAIKSDFDSLSSEKNGSDEVDLKSDSEILRYSGNSCSVVPVNNKDHTPCTEGKLRKFIDAFVEDKMESINDKEEMETDIEDSKQLQSYSCDLCSHAFEGCTAIKDHMLQHTKLSPHYCTRCDLYFVLAGNMKTHLNQHEIEDPYVCKLCNEVFQTSEGLDSHGLTHVENYPYKCGVCQRGFQIKSAYDLHMRFHSNTVFECSVCNMNLSSKVKLQSHKRKEHFIYDDKKYRFSCDLCKMKFAGPESLRRHKRYSHNIEWDELVNKKHGLKYYWRQRKYKFK